MLNLSFDDFLHGKADVSAGQLHYRLAGEGETVVLLHGWPQHSLQWHAVAPLLAQQYQVLIPDMPGCGGSSIPKNGAYDRRSIAGSIHELTVQLELDRVSLVGYDHGAGVAYNYASLYRDAVDRLAVVEFVLPGCGYEQVMMPTPDWATSKDWQLAFFTVPDVAEFAFRGRERELLTWFFWHDSANPFAVDPAHLQQYVDQIAKPGALRAGLEYYAAVWEDLEINREHMRRKLTIPVLGVGGRHSMAEFTAQQLAPVADSVAGAVVEGAGHWPSDEAPESLADILLDFLAANPSVGTPS